MEPLNELSDNLSIIFDLTSDCCLGLLADLQLHPDFQNKKIQFAIKSVPHSNVSVWCTFQWVAAPGPDAEPEYQAWSVC